MKIERIHNLTGGLLPILLTDSDGKYTGRVTMLNEEYFKVLWSSNRNTICYKETNIRLRVLSQQITLPPPREGHIYIVKKELAQRLSSLRDDVYYPYHNLCIDKNGLTYPSEEYGLVKLNIKISPDKKVEDKIHTLTEVHNFTDRDFCISSLVTSNYYPSKSVLIPHHDDTVIKERDNYEGLEIAEYDDDGNMLLYNKTISITLPPRREGHIYIVGSEIESYVSTQRTDIYSVDRQSICPGMYMDNITIYGGFNRTDLRISDK